MFIGRQIEIQRGLKNFNQENSKREGRLERVWGIKIIDNTNNKL